MTIPTAAAVASPPKPVDRTQIDDPLRSDHRAATQTANADAFASRDDDSHAASPPEANPPEAVSDDPFADLPEFQGVEAPVPGRAGSGADFHRMMMADTDPDSFSVASPSPSPPLSPPADRPVSSTTPAATSPDDVDLVGVLGSLDQSIQQAVETQRRKSDAAVRAKFTPEQIRDAFNKPIGEVPRLSGLRSKQLRSALAVFLVPIGFMLFVPIATLALILIYRAWIFGDSEGLPNPVIGFSFLLACLVVALCWLPALHLMFAIYHLFIGRPEDDEGASHLTRQSQPALYEFVDQVCAKLGAPTPCRIDLNCDFNATASLRRGWLGSGRDDLVLTIGVPLIAIHNTEQFASVIAHEFGHFRQGSAMKTYYVIATLTNWFMQVAASGARYFSLFGYLTHLLSGSLSRDMEWDADRHAVYVAGSQAFCESSALVQRYGVAYAVTLDNLAKLLQVGVLVDNIPRLMRHIGKTMPASVIRRVAEETERERLDLLDSHPPTRDRVQAARDLNQVGVISIQRPAIDLVDHWDPLCRKITRDFYREHLGLTQREVDEAHFTPLEELLRDEHKLLLDRAPTS
ncbi:M48 family metalloprotease [Roseiconus nitratireducens]|uniref:M48 family metalloprotease n=1 Tax=Roseiconus nitratireducens TaxID=2605748 RepID=UPI001375F707|nr:M48 family metalloprotease [Roseiconus nitratireducens]